MFMINNSFHTHINTSLTHTHIRTHAHTQMHAHTYTNAYTHTHADRHTYTHAARHTDTHMQTYHTYTHTHMRTQTLLTRTLCPNCVTFSFAFSVRGVPGDIRRRQNAFVR